MAWKPWYERAMEISSAEERTEFIRGALYGSNERPGLKAAQSVLVGFLIGYGIQKAAKRFR